MKSIPPYFKQEKSYTCSLAVLRMVLSSKNNFVLEESLVEKVKKDYGVHFKNIWNPTIAKLACEYGVKTRMYAVWPLFKKENFKKALKEYKQNPESFNYLKYENLEDKDSLPEPLPLSYKEMFAAVELGCKAIYKELTEKDLKKILTKKYLIQTSVKLNKLYESNNGGYHSILLYDFKDDTVFYHDPDKGDSLSVSFKKLLSAMQDSGAVIVYC